MMVKIEIFQHKGIRFMFLDNYLWMWDTEQEKRLQQDLNKNAFGDVLVVGYGLGLLSKLLTKNPKVKSVTTVEIYEEIIEKMRKLDKIHGKIIISDFYDLVENQKFDCVIGDSWPDIDSRFLKDCTKFKRKAQKLLKKDGKILAWGKDYYEYLLTKSK